MITASISGKMAFDARVIKTKSGTPMTTGRLAVDDKQSGDEKQVLQLVADNVRVPTAKPKAMKS